MGKGVREGTEDTKEGRDCFCGGRGNGSEKAWCWSDTKLSWPWRGRICVQETSSGPCQFFLSGLSNSPETERLGVQYHSRARTSTSVAGSSPPQSGHVWGMCGRQPNRCVSFTMVFLFLSLPPTPTFTLSKKHRKKYPQGRIINSNNKERPAQAGR